jgi:1,4-alpha-glucan branching enzyme
MSIKKKYLKNKSICRVTFELPLADSGIRDAHLVGEFNAWSRSAHPMKLRKNGLFSTTLDLDKGKEYQFRYLLAGSIWKNEPQADKSIPTPYGDSDNSVIVL